MAGAFDFGSVLESRGLTGGGGVVQNLTNFLTGKRGNLSGPNDFTAIYDYFFRTLLSSTNGLPIRPLWILFFDSFPSATDIDKYAWGISTNGYYSTAIGTDKNRPGAIYAQGVKVPGEENEIIRTKIEHSGMIGGLHSEGRGNFPTLEVDFLETNYSFTDFVLRPWSIAVAHNGLKNEKFTNFNINCWHLAKTPNGFIPRKQITYEGVAPISIDTENYTYDSANGIMHRQVTFSYRNYTIRPGQSIDAQSVFGDMLGRIFGNLNPAKLLDRALGSAKDLITGTLDNIVTNVSGKVTGAIDNAINSVQSGIRADANRLVNNVSNSVSDAVDEITRIDNNEDTPGFNVNNTVIAAEESTFGRQQSINNNDTPNNISFQQVLISPSDYTPQLKEIKDWQSLADALPPQFDGFKDINADDTPVFARTHAGRLIGPSTDMSINDDTPRFIELPPNDVDIGDPNADTPNPLGIPVQVVKVLESDVIAAGGVPSQLKEINKEDTPDGQDILSQPIIVDAKDTPENTSLGVQIVVIDKNDAAQQIHEPNQNVNIRGDDAIQKTHVANQNVIVPRNDVPIKSQLQSQLVTIRSDPVKSALISTITRANVEPSDTPLHGQFDNAIINTNDVVVKSGIPVHLIEIKRIPLEFSHQPVITPTRDTPSHKGDEQRGTTK